MMENFILVLIYAFLAKIQASKSFSKICDFIKTFVPQPTFTSRPLFRCIHVSADGKVEIFC